MVATHLHWGSVLAGHRCHVSTMSAHVYWGSTVAANGCPGSTVTEMYYIWDQQRLHSHVYQGTWMPGINSGCVGDQWWPHHNIIIIIGFLINVQVQGQHPHQWAPFQIASLLQAWQISHQISRSSIMRVDSRELPLSAIPLCQLLPCHFGSPRPTLSINLYVKDCLDCTTGAFYMSIP